MISKTKAKTIIHPCQNCPAFNKSFLNSLPLNHIVELKEQAIEFSLGPGEEIIVRDEQLQGMFCIRSGIIKLYLDSISIDNVTIGFRTTGDTIGYHGIEGAMNIFSATCVTDSAICLFPKKIIQKHLQENIELLKVFNLLLIKELEEITVNIAGNLYKSTSQRVAAALLQIKNKVGVDESNYIAAPVTRQALAHMVGARIESVFRALAFLKKKKWIEVYRRQVKIIDEKKLSDFQIK